MLSVAGIIERVALPVVRGDLEEIVTDPRCARPFAARSSTKLWRVGAESRFSPCKNQSDWRASNSTRASWLLRRGEQIVADAELEQGIVNFGEQHGRNVRF